MKILVTTPSLEIGGTEIFLARLLNTLSEKGIRVFLLDFEREKRDQELLRLFSKNITILDNPIGSHFLKKVLGKLEYTFKLKQDVLSHKFYSFFLKNIIRKHDISIIHSHLYRSDKIIATCVTGIPTVTTLHGCYNFFRQDRSTEMYTILSTFEAIIYIAERNLIPFQHIEKKENLLVKAIKIYNGLTISGIQEPVTKASSNNLPRVVIVSRCIKEKGWDIVIEAVKRLNSPAPVVELDLVGDGEYLDVLKRKHAQEQSIFFSGKVINVDAHIAMADLCCFPSVYPNESLPNSIMEYMANKKAIITNTIGEVEQMVTMDDGSKCARLAPSDASDEELMAFYCREIKELIENKPLREELAEKAAENIKKFDITRTADAYLKLYNTFKKKN